MFSELLGEVQILNFSTYFTDLTSPSAQNREKSASIGRFSKMVLQAEP